MFVIANIVLAVFPSVDVDMLVHAWSGVVGSEITKPCECWTISILGYLNVMMVKSAHGYLLAASRVMQGSLASH